MPSQPDRKQALLEARQLAHQHGLFIVEKRDPHGPFYLLYRPMPTTSVLIGRRSNPQALHTLVRKAAATH